MRAVLGLSLVLLAGSAVAQFPAGTLPPNYKLVLENSDVLVYRVHYGPREKIAEHDHSDFATVYVYLNDSGPVKISHAGATDSSVVTRPPTHTGAFRVGTGRFERHAVENLSDLPSDFLRVELKKDPSSIVLPEFRGAAPAPPFPAGTEVLYATPELRVERTLFSPGESKLPAIATPSVVVTVPLTGPGTPRVKWVEKGHTVSEPVSDGELEMLRIVLPKD